MWKNKITWLQNWQNLLAIWKLYLCHNYKIYFMHIVCIYVCSRKFTTSNLYIVELNHFWQNISFHLIFPHVSHCIHYFRYSFQSYFSFCHIFLNTPKDKWEFVDILGDSRNNVSCINWLNQYYILQNRYNFGDYKSRYKWYIRSVSKWPPVMFAISSTFALSITLLFKACYCADLYESKLTVNDNRNYF